MERLAASAEPGVVVFVRMGMGEEIARTLGAHEGASHPIEAGPLREYGVGAQILKDLGVRRMILMSNTRPNVLPGLDGYGLTVEGWRKIDPD
jgi:3,4-dihydroxy 2-butanone 4-phosphate synthase/GTP cyclohydrolase II